MEVSDCAIMSDPMTCGAGLQQATKVINQPDLFFVGYISNSTIGYTPNLDKENNSVLIHSCICINCLALCISNRITAGVKYILPKKVSKRVGIFTMVYGTAVEQALLDQNNYFLQKTVCIF